MLVVKPEDFREDRCPRRKGTSVLFFSEKADAAVRQRQGGRSEAESEESRRRYGTDRRLPPATRRQIPTRKGFSSGWTAASDEQGGAEDKGQARLKW